MSIVDLEEFDRTPVQRDPRDFLVVPNFIRPEFMSEMNRDYPEISEPESWSADLSDGNIHNDSRSKFITDSSRAKANDARFRCTG